MRNGVGWAGVYSRPALEGVGLKQVRVFLAAVAKSKILFSAKSSSKRRLLFNKVSILQMIATFDGSTYR